MGRATLCKLHQRELNSGHHTALSCTVKIWANAHLEPFPKGSSLNVPKITCGQAKCSKNNSKPQVKQCLNPAMLVLFLTYPPPLLRWLQIYIYAYTGTRLSKFWVACRVPGCALCNLHFPKLPTVPYCTAPPSSPTPSTAGTHHLLHHMCPSCCAVDDMLHNATPSCCASQGPWVSPSHLTMGFLSLVSKGGVRQQKLEKGWGALRLQWQSEWWGEEQCPDQEPRSHTLTPQKLHGRQPVGQPCPKSLGYSWFQQEKDSLLCRLRW